MPRYVAYYKDSVGRINSDIYDTKEEAQAYLDRIVSVFRWTAIGVYPEGELPPELTPTPEKEVLPVVTSTPIVTTTPPVVIEKKEISTGVVVLIIIGILVFIFLFEK